MRCSGLAPRPSRDFVPAADLLSCANKKVGKEIAPAKPALRASLRCSKPRAVPNSLRSLRSLRSDKRRESVLEASFARALGFCASRRFRRGAPKYPIPNTQQPALAGCCIGLLAVSKLPLKSRRAAQPGEARAQRASTTDSAQLFDHSERSERREFCAGLVGRAAQGTRRAAFSGRFSCLLLWAPKEVGRPPGRTPGTGLGIKQQHQRQAPSARLT
jgi:hypothetical protein